MGTHLKAEERRSRVLELIRAQGFAALPDLAVALKVSESTVRRDLDYLEVTGVARRTHGGAFYSGPSPKSPHFDVRQAVEWDRKRQIATEASRLIKPGDTVLLDGGSTTYELARLLVGKPLQVVTNSLPVALLFSATDTVDLVFIGGYIHARTGCSLGPYANEMLANLNVQRAVLSVAGIHTRGFFNSNLLLVETERAMLRAADQVLVVADSTKFNRTGLAFLCGWEEIDVLVTDDRVDECWRQAAREAGVELISASPERGDPQGD